MKDRKPDSDSSSVDDDLKAAEEALADARKMPSSPERILALKRAGQMRFDAEQRRRAESDTASGSYQGSWRNPRDDESR